METFDSIRTIERDGDHAVVAFATDGGEERRVRIPLAGLWAVASDLRQASIHLLAPVPLYSPGAFAAQLDAAGEKPDERDEDDAAEQVPSDFAAVEQAWEFCDILNADSAREAGSGPGAPEDIYNARVADNPAVDPEADNLESLRAHSYIRLKSGLIVRYIEDTGEWLPDRPPEEAEQAEENRDAAKSDDKEDEDAA